MSESKHTPEPVESCDTCKNNGGTRGECQNESCAYEPKTKPLEVELAALRKQRDELLAAAEAIEINGEECLDFDECTAMLVPIDDYHKLVEAIASVKGGG